MTLVLIGNELSAVGVSLKGAGVTVEVETGVANETDVKIGGKLGTAGDRRGQTTLSVRSEIESRGAEGARVISLRINLAILNDLSDLRAFFVSRDCEVRLALETGGLLEVV